MNLRALTRQWGRLASAGLCLGAGCAFESSVQARVVNVDDTAGLARVLSAVGSGDVIELRAGEYTPVIRDFHGSATIRSADPTKQAVFKSLILQNSSGLSIVQVTFSTEGYPAESYGVMGTIPFKIAGSSNITLTSLDVHGSPHGSLATDEFGISVRNSQHVTIEGSNFHNLHGGIVHLDDEFITFKNNDFHELRDDAIRGGGSSNVLIEGNHCHNNHPDGAIDADHPDCIQFWTSNTNTSAHDIVVSGNRYERERGHATQFIFLGNEKHIPYDHVLIKDNVSTGSLWNSIAISDARDVTIINNTLNSLCAPESGQTNVAWIRTKNIDGLVLRNNRAGSFMDQGGSKSVQASNNTTKGCVK